MNLAQAQEILAKHRAAIRNMDDEERAELAERDYNEYREECIREDEEENWRD